MIYLLGVETRSEPVEYPYATGCILIPERRVFGPSKDRSYGLCTPTPSPDRVKSVTSSGGRSGSYYCSSPNVEVPFVPWAIAQEDYQPHHRGSAESEGPGPARSVCPVLGCLRSLSQGGPGRTKVHERTPTHDGNRLRASSRTAGRAATACPNTRVRDSPPKDASTGFDGIGSSIPTGPATINRQRTIPSDSSRSYPSARGSSGSVCARRRCDLVG